MKKENSSILMPSFKHFTLVDCIVVIAIFFLVSSCGPGDNDENVSNSKDQKTSTLTIVDNLKELTWGDSIKVSIRSNNDTVSVAHVSVVIHKKNLMDVNGGQLTIASKKLLIGKQLLTFNVSLSNGQSEQHKKRFFIKSDVVPESLTHQVINKFPHDPDAYTQGLLFDHDRLLESTGQKGESAIRQIELGSGKVLQSVDLDSEFFGEGIATYEDKLFQLSWKAKKGFIYDKNSFEQVGSFQYQTEGWGFTTIDSSLVMSDGTNLLYFLDPNTLNKRATIQVYDQNTPVLMLNELEYINGKIYANIWQKDEIVSIDPKTGRVLERIDMTGIFNYKNYGRRIDVLNGIAYHKAEDKIYVTGKYWPKIFEVKFVKN